MSWFRRKDDEIEPREGQTSRAETEADDAIDATDATDEADAERSKHGPLDVAESDPDERRIDLGALQLPGRQNMELRLEVEDNTQRVIAVTVAMGGSTLQMQAFAAPRTLGVWDEIRTEISAQVNRQGGTADEVPGPFGRELIARIPVRTPDGRSGHAPSRFVGIDGPRWFLRGVFGGPAAHDAAAAAALEDVLRSAVVVRGSEAMAPRDLLPLTLPAGASKGPPRRPAPAPAPAPAVAAAETPPPGVPADTPAPRTEDDLAPFERGPEITETR